MLDLGELAARIRVDDSAVPAELEQVHRRFGRFHTQVETESGAAGTRAGSRLSGGFSGSVRSGLSRASTGVASTLSGTMATFTRFGAAGVAALGAVGAAGLGMGVKIAAGNENAEIAFTTMLGSGKRARAFLGELQQFAAKTPFEFPELQTAASSLISAGVSAKNVIPIMTSLGNATSGMGTGSEGIKRATVALQQMNAAGRITAEDLNQLRDAGIPVYDLLAKATGKSKKEIAALAQTGKLGKKELDQLMAALSDGKGLERFNGLMEKQSASLSGMWSTVKDNLGQGLARAVAPVIPLLKDGLGGAAEFIAASLKKAPPILNAITVGVRGLWGIMAKGEFNGDISKTLGLDEDSKIIDVLFDIREGLVGTRKAASAWWKATKSAEAKPFMAALGSIGDSLYRLSPFADNAKDSTFGLTRAFPLLTKVAHLAVGGLGHVADALAWLADHKDQIGGWFSGAGAKVKESLAPIGRAIRGVWDQVKGMDGDTVRRAIDTVVDGLAQLGPMLTDFTGSLPAVTPTLHLVGEGLKFVADHVDLVGKALPYLIAGFAAYKAAQAANAAVGRDSLVGFGLQLASTIALTASNFALAASQQAVDATDRAGIITRVRSAAATVAHGAAVVATTVASVAANVATKAWAAAQWLMNAALTANPIGLVVVAIGLLVGGLIYAYKHSERFRAVVDKTFSWVKENVPKALQAAWHGIKSAWGSITGAFSDAYHWVTGVFKKNWRTIAVVLGGPLAAGLIAVHDHWDQITGAFSKAKSWVTGTWKKGWAAVSGVISGGVAKARDKVSDAWDDVKAKFSKARSWVTGTWKKGWSAVRGTISGVVTGARDKISDAWDDIKGKFSSVRKWVTGTFRKSWAGIKLLLSDPVEFGRNLIDNLLGKDTGVRHLFDAVGRWIRGTFKRSWSGLKTLLTDPVQFAKNAIVNLLGEDNASGLRGKFSSFVRAAGRIWDGLKDAMKSPIVAVIKIINTGLIGAYNWVVDKLKIGGHIDPISIKGFRTGGATGSGRDDETAGVVHRNEHVATADEVRRGGGHATWEKARALARAGRLANVVNGLLPRGVANPKPTDDPIGPQPVLPSVAGVGNLNAVAARGPQDAGGLGGAVERGKSMVGDMGWYNRCLAFVNAAWGFTVGRFRLATARASMNAGPRSMAGRPPGGAGVYWDTGPSGHIALAVGDGSVISNDIVKAGRLDRVPQQRLNAWGPYRGWWHPKGAKGGDGFDAGGEGSAPVKASWLGKFANPSAFLKDRATKAMDQAGLGNLGGSAWASALKGIPAALLSKIVDKIKGVAASAWHDTGFAAGTFSAPRGFAWTGEKGAELVLNPQMRKYTGGEQVLNARDTRRAMSGDGTGQAGDRPYIGSVTLVSSGNVHRDLDEVMWRVRTTSRGGVYSAPR